MAQADRVPIFCDCAFAYLSKTNVKLITEQTVLSILVKGKLFFEEPGLTFHTGKPRAPEEDVCNVIKWIPDHRLRPIDHCSDGLAIRQYIVRTKITVDQASKIPCVF